MAINYPATPNFYNPEAVMQQTARGYQSGKDWRDNKNAEAAFGKYLENIYAQGSLPQQQGQPGAPQTLAALGPQFGPSAPVGAVQRAPLGTPDPATARVDQAFAAQGQGNAKTIDGNQIAGRFLKTVKEGGLSNPFALAAVAATGKNESGFAPDKAFGTWSDPSQSGQAGTSGGIMSWRGDRLAKLQQFAQQNGDNPQAPSPETQGKFLLAEDPSLIARLQNAQSPAEAQQIMNQAWKFAGYNQPGGEAGQRIADAQAYAPQFGSGPAPSQQALEGLAVGQPAPMGNGAPQQAPAAPQGGMQPQTAASILPPREVMAELFKSPGTRPLAIQLVQAAQGLKMDQNDPQKQLEYQIAVEKLKALRDPQSKLINAGGAIYDPNTKSWISPPDGVGKGGEASLTPVLLKDKDGNLIYGQATKDGKIVRSSVPDGFQPVSPYEKSFETGRGNAEGKGAGTAASALPSAQNIAQQVTQQIQELKSDAYLPKMLGPLNSRLPNLSGDAARVQGKIDQLQGGAFLQARQMLKGGGAITDYEGVKAEAAFARMSQAQNVEDFNAALDDFNQNVQTGLQKLQEQAGQRRLSDGPQQQEGGVDYKARYGLD